MIGSLLPVQSQATAALKQKPGAGPGWRENSPASTNDGVAVIGREVPGGISRSESMERALDGKPTAQDLPGALVLAVLTLLFAGHIVRLHSIAIRRST
jgi:hypothetical protein